MLLYVEIKMTIISWHTHTTPSHAVQEENGSPRNPCKLPVILPRISTREKVIERLLNVSVAVYETPWSGQSTAIPGFEMILYTVRGSASVHVSWLCSTALEREPHKEPELWTSAHKHTPAHLSKHPCQHSWETEFDYNRHRSCTAPKWFSQHVNIHAFSQELGFCVQCLLLSRLSVPIAWKMVPSDITARPCIPSPLKIQAQPHVLVETFDKRLALSLFAVNKQQGLEHCGEDTLIPRAPTLHTPPNTFAGGVSIPATSQLQNQIHKENGKDKFIMNHSDCNMPA